jgi:branched-chain amino acid transport system permease protein
MGVAAARKLAVAGRLWPLALVAVAIAVVSTEDPVWITLATQAAVWTLWAASLNLIWGYSGQFSMAQTGLGMLSAYVAAILAHSYGAGAYAAIAAGLAASVAASVLIGIAALRLRGFYFAIMTLAFLLVLSAVLENLALAGRTTGIVVSYELGTLSLGPIDWQLDSKRGGFMIACWVVAAAVLAFLARLARLRFGKVLMAIRDDPLLATSFGVDTSAYKIAAFAMSAVIAGVAGILLSIYFRYITPGFFGFDTLITVIVLLVIGGTGRLVGPLVGAVIYVALIDYFRIGGEYRQGVFGLILIAIVIFAPQGIVGLLAGLRSGRAGGIRTAARARLAGVVRR